MRRLILFMVVACVPACGDKTKQKGPPPPKEVGVLTLQPAEVRETSEYLGTLLSRQTVDLRPQVGGYVRKIHVRPGDEVKSGQVLIEVDQRQESAALESAQAQARSVTANLELAQKTLVRTKALYDEGLANAQELERAQAALEAAQAAASSASATVSQRRVQLQFYAVSAPFDGTVGDIPVKIGDFVTQQTLLTSVAQGEALEVGVAVPAERARKIKPGTQVEILDSKGAVIVDTQVYFVSPQADPRTQLVEVKAAFKNAVGLRPAELVRTRIVYGTHSSIVVPPLAVIRQSGQPFVYVVGEKDGKTIVSRKPVTLGELGEKYFVVEKGLQAGDRIAVTSLQALRDGMPIKAVTPPGAPQARNP